MLTAAGGEISIDPQKSAPSIAKDGTISQADASGRSTQVAKLTPVRFADLSALKKDGSNLYVTDETPIPAADAQLRQGMVEHSNVNPVLEMTSLIDITRAYERVQNIINQTQDLSRSAVERLGKAG